ncbi:monocarboxylate transporter 12-like [Dermacentor andersoni]|uniref:monocarboxylate transporter 12-like n=1 Tax=Dermacentor andersoni TaxID=34620 RepID=UPI00241693DB|nr:monocarboxylate transporter 12-like [Dermacentor andersoni]
MVSARRLKDDPLFGVDSRWSWITAFFCAWVLFLAMATPRMAGIFFYGIVETFGTTREEASWPVSLPGSFTVLGGPIAGYLCQRFSCRAVLLSCSCLGGIAVSLCYLANNVLFITISFGILHGTASSGLYVASNVLLSQHFEKRRATASSVVFAAFGLNSIFITPLIEFFRTAYGIRGAFLVYGAILLNAIPAVIVLRSPLWLTNSKVERNATNNEENETSAACVLIQPVNGDVSVAKNTESNCPHTNQRSNFEQSTASCAKPPDNLSRAGVFPPTSSVKLMETNKTVISFTLPTVTRQLCTLSFLVYALSFAVVILIVGIFTTIAADLASDRGMNPSNAVYFLQALSAADIAFRSVAGIAIDSRRLSLESVMLIGYVVQGLTCEWLVWANTSPQMVLASILLGATYGSRTCLQAPALAKNFGIGTLPVVLGSVLFCTGVLLLLRPPLIGYYRDNYGDYTGLLHLMAALNGIFVCIWTLKIIIKRRARTTATLPTLQDAPLSKSSANKNGSRV